MSSPSESKDEFHPYTIPYTGSGAVSIGNEYAPSGKAVGDVTTDSSGMPTSRIPDRQTPGTSRIPSNTAVSVPNAPYNHSQPPVAPYMAILPIERLCHRNPAPLHSSSADFNLVSTSNPISGATPAICNREEMNPSSFIGMPSAPNKGVVTLSKDVAARTMKIQEGKGGFIYDPLHPNEGSTATSSAAFGNKNRCTENSRTETSLASSSSGSTKSEAGDNTNPIVAKRSKDVFSTKGTKGPIAGTIHKDTYYNGTYAYPYTPCGSPASNTTPDTTPKKSDTEAKAVDIDHNTATHLDLPFRRRGTPTVETSSGHRPQHNLSSSYLNKRITKAKTRYQSSFTRKTDTPVETRETAPEQHDSGSDSDWVLVDN
ncbi:hypothetical protein NKR23_g2961 [Pleurostoma richardsiae]|uniref:Uncharacterized protein n=1 Tax=Pleurostoma richardsiae TaxID=41990 RepID=A0AA38S6U3_9PEZI|nr:hypothetical protein NKR23_g2961 [Pleurostoma richardsiae]